MKTFLKKHLVTLMRETADKIDAGTCELDEDEAIEILSAIGHEKLYKEDACNYVHLSRSRFDDLVRLGVIPRGRRNRSCNNLYWYKDELDEVLRHTKFSGIGKQATR